MKRYGSSNNLVDEFNYQYFSGTNRLKRVTGSTDQYAYDANGNMTKDDFNWNNNIIYDYRNLMTDIRTIRQENGLMGPEDKTYWTRYRYDEAGNRTRKIIYKYTGSEPDPIYEDGGDNPLWQFISDEFYVRDISGTNKIFKIINEKLLKDGNPLAHIQNYAAAWRDNHGIKTEYLYR